MLFKSRFMKWVLISLGVAAGLYVGLFALLYVAQRKLLYQAARAPGGRLLPAAAQAGLEPWEVNGQFYGWRTTNHQARASVILFHGNAGHALYMTSFLSGLQAATRGQVQVYLMEYPGYGPRSGEPSEETLIQAARAGLESLPRERPVYLMGQSLGCAVAAGLWAEAPTSRIHGVILVVPFNNLCDTAQHHFPIYPMRLLLKDRYASDVRLSRDRGPLYVALAEKDGVIPVELGRKLYDGYPGRKKLMVKAGAGHNDLNHPDEAWWREALGFVAPELVTEN